MNILDEVKDTARKAKNAVVDTTENITGIVKSPRELAKRLVEHLKHKEFKKIAQLLTEEAEKYCNNLGLSNFTVVNQKLEIFKEQVGSIAENFEQSEYQKIADKLTDIKNSMPEPKDNSAPIFNTIRNFLDKMIDIMKNSAREINRGNITYTPDYTEIENTFAKYFEAFVSKK